MDDRQDPADPGMACKRFKRPTQYRLTCQMRILLGVMTAKPLSATGGYDNHVTGMAN